MLVPILAAAAEGGQSVFGILAALGLGAIGAIKIALGAKGAPGWHARHCPHCGSRMRAGYPTCRKCGRDR